MSDDRLEELDDAQRALAMKLRASLRATESVDAATSGRLAHARARAVAEAGSRSRPAWLWASGSAAAATILAALLLLQSGGLSRWHADPAEANVADALEVMTDELDAEFYEDLDLYRWLADDGRA